MELAARSMERLIATEMRRRGRARGHKWAVAEVVWQAETEPCILVAARALDRPPCRVAIVTGAAVPEHMPVGENDGPFGAVALAQRLAMIGHSVNIWSDEVCLPPIAGLLAHVGAEAQLGTLVKDDIDQQTAIAEDADIVIAVERLGGNVNGHLHGISGMVRDPFRTNVDHIFRHASKIGRTTIGIGDGGNEVGFGKIREALIAALPDHNQTGATPCGGGIYSAVATDILVFGTTSNIGAYGVLGALAMLRDEIDLCHDSDLERDMHYVGVGLGLSDGGGGGVVPICDGIPAESNAAMTLLIQTIAARYLEAPRDRAF